MARKQLITQSLALHQPLELSLSYLNCQSRVLQLHLVMAQANSTVEAEEAVVAVAMAEEEENLRTERLQSNILHIPTLLPLRIVVIDPQPQQEEEGTMVEAVVVRMPRSPMGLVIVEEAMVGEVEEEAIVITQESIDLTAPPHTANLNEEEAGREEGEGGEEAEEEAEIAIALELTKDLPPLSISWTLPGQDCNLSMNYQPYLSIFSPNGRPDQMRCVIARWLSLKTIPISPCLPTYLPLYSSLVTRQGH
jgi:hypothetical protein